jgi:hypothetical protein
MSSGSFAKRSRGNDLGTAAAATGCPPGFHWGRFGAAIHWELSNCGGLAGGVAWGSALARCITQEA